LRVCATVAVVLLHTADGAWADLPVGSFDWQVTNVAEVATRWAVPIFVMVSGMFLLARPLPDDFTQEWAGVRKRAGRILAALIAWGLLYNLLDIALGIPGSTPAEVGDELLGLPARFLLQPAWYHLWFLYMIIGLYLITPILARFVAGASRRVLEYALLLCLSGTVVRLVDHFLTLGAGGVERTLFFPLDEVTGYAGYFLAGHYFSRYDLSRGARRLLHGAALVSAVAILAGATVLSQSFGHDGMLYAPLSPGIAVISASVFVAFKDGLSGRVPSPRWDRRWGRLSELSFGVYLVHALVLTALSLIGFSATAFLPLLAVPLVALVTVVVSYAVAALLAHLPVARKLI
jgi:surface polysaccharide O-acyltransferase-like enzyme